MARRKDVYYQPPGKELADRLKLLAPGALPPELLTKLVSYLENSKSTKGGRPRNRQDIDIAETGLEEEYQRGRRAKKLAGVRAPGKATLEEMADRYNVSPRTLENILSKARVDARRRESQ